MRRQLIIAAACLAVITVAWSQAPATSLDGYQGKVPRFISEQKGIDVRGTSLSPEATGGPDGFGYTFIDSNEGGGPAYSWVELDASGTQVQLGDDEVSASVPIGFSFAFYSGSFTTVAFSSNGFLVFGGDTNSDLSNDCPIPNAGGANNLIGVMWDDLDPGDNSDPLWYQSFGAGSCPYGSYAGACFVAEYQGYSLYNSGGAVDNSAGTFEVILFDDATFLLQYQDVGTQSGSSATVGIENGDGSIGLAYSCDSASLASNLAILFELPEGADLALTKTALTDPVAPGGNATFALDLVNNGPLDATGVMVTDMVPSGMTYVSDTCGGGLAGSTWTWNVGGLVDGASAQCSITMTVDVCAALSNTATATCNEPDLPGDSTSTVTLNSSFDVIEDGSFEAGTPNPFWNEASTNFGTPLCDEGGCGTGGGTAGPLTGDWWAWFGGATTDETAIVNQDVVIGPGSTLSFYLWAPTPTAGTADGTFDVYIDSTSIFQIAQGAAPYDTGYQLVTLDLSAFGDDASHNVRFEGIQNGPDVVTFNVDDVALTSCGTAAEADLAIQKTGGIGSYGIMVTNNGPDDASGVAVTDPLPAGVTYVSDTCGGSVNGQLWTWNIGGLANGASVSCTISVQVTNPMNTTNVATVSTSDNDPVGSNNSATAVLQEEAVPAIPTLGTIGALILILVLGGCAVLVIRRFA